MNEEVQVGDLVVSLVNYHSTKKGEIYTVCATEHSNPSGVWLKETQDYLMMDEFALIDNIDDLISKHTEKVAKETSDKCFNKLKGVNLHEDATITSEPMDTGLIDKQEHYTANGIQPIELMRQNFTPEAFQGFLEGNIIKYVLRHRRKNGVEDLRKAMTYLTWLIDEEENE